MIAEMYKIKRGNYMKMKKVIFVVCLILCVILININGNAKESLTTASNEGNIWIQANDSMPENTMLDENWIHYDDGDCDYSYGLIDPGYWVHEAIVLTPTELADYTGAFVSLKVMHGDDISYNYIAWINEKIDPPNDDPLDEATIVATGNCPAVEDWFYINFTTPYPFSPTGTYWVGVGCHQIYGYTSPWAFDMDTYAAGKSDWVWSSEYGMIWLELSDCGFPCSWGLWVGVAPDTTPPVTTCTLTGTQQDDVYITDVTATLTATDSSSGVNYTMYKVDEGTWATYTAPVTITGNGQHIIHYYSIDNAGNQEIENTTTFTINYPILITIKGGLGVSAMIQTNITVSNVIWSINLSGFILFGKSKIGGITILDAGESATVRDFCFGFDRPTITVEVTCHEDITAKQTVTTIVFGPFVMGIK